MSVAAEATMRSHGFICPRVLRAGFPGC